MSISKFSLYLEQEVCREAGIRATRTLFSPKGLPIVKFSLLDIGQEQDNFFRMGTRDLSRLVQQDGVNKMDDETMSFKDYYQNEVSFSFAYQPYSEDPKHVWVICRFHNQWLLTQHPRRGWEFPGGKVEEGETADEAAIREVGEETGAEVSELFYIGQYKVDGKSGSIVKNVYYANISLIKLKDHYLETSGPVFIHSIPKDIKRLEKYSFMMKDDVLTCCMKRIKQQYLKAPPQN